jgi:hypothetical protein
MRRCWRSINAWSAITASRASSGDVVADIADELRDAGVDLGDVFEQIVDLVIGNLDDKDRRQQSDTLQWAADALQGDTILGADDPVLDRVCAVGGGIRKAYRYLEQGDLLAIIQRKADHAAAAATAAAETARVASTLLGAMNMRRARWLGELFDD